MSSPKFTVGSAVFVKMRGYPAWPAKVEGIADETPNKVKYHIFFYGTNQIAVCKEEEMCSYLKFREMLGKPKKVKGFNEAILEMDLELGLVTDPIIKEKIEKAKNLKRKHSCDGMMQTDDTEIVFIKHSCIEPSTSQSQTTVSHPDIEIKHSYDELLSILKLESQLVSVDYGIQSSLNLKEADPEACLDQLNKLSNLNFSNLMLKKHPEIVYTLIKLQMYVGNTKNWNMTEDAIKIFKSKADKIQNKAKLILDKIQAMIQVPEGIAFLDYFEQELYKFKEITKNMPLEDFFHLIKDPTNV